MIPKILLFGAVCFSLGLILGHYWVSDSAKPSSVLTAGESRVVGESARPPIGTKIENVKSDLTKTDSKPPPDVPLEQMEQNKGEDKKNILKIADVTNFRKSLKTALPANAKALETLSGHYAGKIKFDSLDQPPWNVAIDLDAQPVGHEATGQFNVTVTSGETILGHSQGNGKISGFSAIPADPKGLIIEMLHDTGYGQVYPSQNGNELFGYFFLRPHAGEELSRVGTVSLYRVNLK